MSTKGKEKGILKPMGGGDPIPLLKMELTVGRRPSNDICLDFTNISGKHCVLRLVNSVWHVRDLGSTNGTTLNGAKLSSEHSVMPDDELGFAGHLFSIDYEPGGPETVINKHQVLEEEMVQTKKKKSLMEMAGLDTDDNKPRHLTRAKRAPEQIERLSVDEADFDDAVPEHFELDTKKPTSKAEDDDFLKFIEDEVKEPD
jgi:predicted component of type VI protein secretion system